MATGPSRTIVDRMRGAAMLDVATYEEVEHDTSATGQAAVVVVLAAIAAGIGAAGRGGPGVVGMIIASLLGWLAWAGITYFVGTRLFGGTATWGELLRTVGFAQAPGILSVLAIIPLLGGIVRLILFCWMLATSFVAVRQALDIDNGKTFLTVLVGAVAYFVINWVVLATLGIGMR